MCNIGETERGSVANAWRERGERDGCRLGQEKGKRIREEPGDAWDFPSLTQQYCRVRARFLSEMVQNITPDLEFLKGQEESVPPKILFL